MSDIIGIGARPGMECMPLRAPPGPYHYHHVADQTKSLQELQNEVGALLEFRDLVIETFPDLKHKMASMSTTNTLTGMASGSSLVSRREWEPGIRVKRKLGQKETAEMSSSLIRSRSNSHSGKKEPKSGEGNGSVVQDSGFSTETSSSKEAHSASSTTGAMQGAVASNRLPIDSDDELLNLLDVIHRKSNRLRDEVEHLQNLERDKFRKTTNNLNLNSSNINSNSSNNNNNSNSSNSTSTCLIKTFHDHVARLSKEDIQLLRKERDRLLDKLAEMEAETLTERIKSTKIQDQFEELCSVKKELEEQLKLALSQKLELHSRLQELHKVYPTNKNLASSTDSPNHRQNPGSVMQLANTATTGSRISTRAYSPPAASTFTPVQLLHQLSTSPVTTADLDSNSCSTTPNSKAAFYPFHHHSDYNKQVKNDLNNLGRLDGLVSSPNRVKVRVTDSKKVAAILLETNVLELQRHLLTLTVQNQVLNQRLEQATKSRLTLLEKLGKSKEEIDDMRFQLEEKDIELEGTKAQLRVLEAKTASSKSDYSTETNRSSSTMIISPRGDSPPITPTQISTPSMKAMTPLAMEEIQQHSSSTESAQDQTERDSRLGPDTPKRRPSKIPLPGTKGYLAPKPPTGRTFVPQQRSPSSSAGSVSNKSLSRSTGSLYGKSGPPSVNKRESYSSSLNRPDSAQSLRKDASLGTSPASRSSTSSIPISSKSTPSPQRISNSPLPRPKRDSLTSRARHLDSLSRLHTSNTSTNGYNSQSNSNSSNTMNSNNSTITTLTATTTITTTGSVTNLHKASSKKDLSSSFTQGQLRDRNKGAVSVRRVSSASIGRNATAAAAAVDLQQQSDSDSGKILRKTVSYDIQELNRLSRSSSFYGPSYSTSSSTTSTSSTRNTPATATISTSSSTPSSPMRSSFNFTNNSNRSRNYTARDLIREFMAKNCSPPAILKPSYQPYECPKDLELAYQHPQLLRVDQKVDQDIDLPSSSSSTNIERYQQEEEKFDTELYLNQDANVEISQNARACKNIDNPRMNNNTPSCKLVGNVAENLVKTWERINSNYCIENTQRPFKSGATKRDLVLARSVSNNSDESEPMIYYQQVDENKASFHVNKVVYLEDEETSDNFYDSIDDAKNYESETDDDDNIISMYQDDAGEELANVESYERRRQQWSFDSELKI
ncbi:serine-rich adhesin for platelets isoform X6 [Hermetia illucens]|uniref:serine-rich adhesin for platelets isoform X6 n=1 Tax=Hermetia illucens TaxID=343691 RepID=UPI0018CC4DD9|nr:serine-rich adhesin for platelets isoform X6 [Hermetia illucens]